MSMLLKFRMLSDEDDNFLRDYEVPYDTTLLDFHQFICNDLNYDDQNITSFFLSDKQWAKLREFTLMDMGMEEAEDDLAPIAMEKVKLSQIIKRHNDRLIYQFDMLDDRALYLELTGTVEGNAAAHVVLANGIAPDQFDPEASVVNRSIFDEAMSDFDDFSGEDAYGEDE